MTNFVSSLFGSILGGGVVGGLLSRYLIEKYKVSLSAKLFERQTRYAWLHTERSKVLVEAYRRLSAMHAAFNLLLSPIQIDASKEAEKGRIHEAADTARELFRYFRENEMFFNDDLAHQLDNLQNEYKKLLIPILAKGAVPVGLELGEAWNKLEGLDPLLKSLKEKIQEMLD